MLAAFCSGDGEYAMDRSAIAYLLMTCMGVAVAVTVAWRIHFSRARVLARRRLREVEEHRAAMERKSIERAD